MKEKHRMRAAKKKLRVTFPDGRIICYSNVTATMIEVLNLIGKDQFPNINLELCHLPLLSQEIYPKYREWMKPICEGWYLNAQSNTDVKYLQLRAINDQLSLGLVIEIGTDFDVQVNPNTERKSRISDKLLVRFPDGEYIGNDSALDTFLEAVWKLGIDEIMRKQVKWGSFDLITTVQLANHQIQIDERRWIVVPGTTKDKAKLLRVLGALLHIKLEVTII